MGFVFALSALFLAKTPSECTQRGFFLFLAQKKCNKNAPMGMLTGFVGFRMVGPPMVSHFTIKFRGNKKAYSVIVRLTESVMCFSISMLAIRTTPT